VELGHVVLPTATVSGEGTSRYYSLEEISSEPDKVLCRLLRRQLGGAGLTWHEGAVWSTDAIYRETVELVREQQQEGVLAVDMEMAALLAVGRFRRVPVAGLLVVSDELSSLKWRPGYRSENFRQTRHQAAELVLAAAAEWEAKDV
jgi:uridine phosphorylase